MARKGLSKKVRFEVFKRDSFTCQYCGGKAPDVLLHVDHIKPVSKGGKNQIINLVTSCRECNLGKSNKELGDKSSIEKQRKQIESLEERRKQLWMMLEWKEEVLDLDGYAASRIADAWTKLSGTVLADWAVGDLGKLVRKFGAGPVMDATVASIDQYFEAKGSSHTFKYIKNICICQKREKEDPLYGPVNRTYNRIKGVMRGNEPARWQTLQAIRGMFENGMDDESVVSLAFECGTWYQLLDSRGE